MVSQALILDVEDVKRCTGHSTMMSMIGVDNRGLSAP